jgi:ribosomal protein S18 acetylase RimI-like enzyme
VTRTMSAPSIEVRAATLGDTPAIADLLTQLGYPNTPPEVGGRLAAMDDDAGDRALVACEGDAVLGFAAVHLIPMIHHDGFVARVTAFVVDASARDRGIGTALFEACEAHAASRAAERLEVTSGDTRTAAHAFYTRRGCAREGQRFTKRIAKDRE